MIEARGLTKRYGPTTAVDDLSFTVRPGVVTGFLGPNGAGKSTTMRMVLGLDRPTAGRVTIGGHTYAELPNPLRTVGALLDAKWVHPNRSARDHLRWMAAAADLPAQRVDEVLETVGLTAVAGKRAGQFSLGMSQRLGIAGTLLGDPEVLMFDEPVNGLDPEGILWIRRFMSALAAEGRTVFVSSHLLSEMALTAEHLIVIGRGRMIADCSTQEFVGRAASGAVLVRAAEEPQLQRALVRRRPDGRPRRRRRRWAPGDRCRRDDRASRRGRRLVRAGPARAHAPARLARGGVHGAYRRRRRVRGPTTRNHRRH